MLNTGAQPITSRHGLLTTIAWTLGSGETAYALEGSVFAAGAAVQWLRDGLGLIAHAAEIEALAREVEDTGGVYFVPAFTGLGAPYWDPRARATIVGITRGTTRAHVARAALESIAFQSADVIAAMEGDSGVRPAQLRVDGGAAANGLAMQFQADVLGVPVVRPFVTQITALGAAFLAGLQIGYWTNLEEVSAAWREEARFVPAMSLQRRAALMDRWHDAVERSRRWS